jgi:hypothetical protein
MPATSPSSRDLVAADVEPGAHRDRGGRQIGNEPARRRHRPTGIGEGGDEPVTGRLDQLSTVALNRCPGDPVVSFDELTPAGVAKGLRSARPARSIARDHSGNSQASSTFAVMGGANTTDCAPLPQRQ